MHRREYLKTMAVGSLSASMLLDSCQSDSRVQTNAMMNPSISQRGLAASKSILRVDLELYFEAVDNLYHPTENPTGAFPLNVAENRLAWPLLKKKMEDLAVQHPIHDWVANYTDTTGAPTFRKVVAEFQSRFLTRCTIDPDHLCLSPGATSVIDLSSWILGEPGDVAVFPAPCYPVYRQDIGNKAGLERFDLVTHHELSALQDGPLLTVQHLDNAMKQIQQDGKRFRMLVITNPDNPTGGMYTKKQLEAYTDWCLSHNIHLIVNEIYGLSQIDTKHADISGDYAEPFEFYSFANIIQQKESDYLHHWYALSKDFGASGFRVGMLYTLNKTFRDAYNNLNAPSMISNYAQWVFELVLTDHAFVQGYIEANQKMLTENYAATVLLCKKLGIPYAPARGSLFVWLDLSEFLDENSEENEHHLWSDLYKETGILLTPGDGFGNTKRGQFRLVYSYMQKDDLLVALNRLAQYVEQKRS
ncbi:MAG: aminotransferase class I/II-fold pyridoxal phosphate-dependent enzyme [Cyclobacteriaceae bacterium]